MADQTPDVKAVNSGDGAGRTAAPALFTVSEHFDIVKPGSELQIFAHIDRLTVK
jgi:hypothetical protein